MAEDYQTAQLFRNQQVPESVRARLAAAQLLQQSAAAANAPYTSKGVVALKALSGLMGGIGENQAIQGEMQAQAAHRAALAQVLMGSGAVGAPASVAAGNGAAAGIPGSAAVANASAPPQSSDARDLAIRTIYGEAGGEPATGQAGVAAVLKNRLVGGQYGNDMQSVILAPKQFSLWNKGDPAGDSARKLDPSSPSYQKIGQIYDGVMSGQIPDPTGGATHYYNPNVAAPAWGPKLAQQNDVRIGNHRFVGTGPVGPNGASSVASADAPASNAKPVSSDTLPPDVTPDMVSAPPSPYGAMPSSMAQTQPSPQALAAALRNQPIGPGSSASPLPASVQPASPFGGLPMSMDQPPAPAPAPMMADLPAPDMSAPDPTSAPLTIQGAPTSPMPIAQQPDAIGGPAPSPQMLASLLSSGVPTPSAPPMMPSDPPLPPPGVQSGAQPGNPFGAMPKSMAQAQPPAPPQSVGLSNPGVAAELSPTGALLSAMSPNGVDPGIAPQLQTAIQASAQPAAGLSSPHLPGMDNFTDGGGAPSGGITATAAPNLDNGFTGAYGGSPIQTAINGSLTGAPSPLGGPAPAPSAPPVGIASATPPSPSAPPPPSLPQTGPMPPPGIQSLAALNPSAPAPNAAPAGPAPLPPQMANPMARALAQPLGLPGDGGGDPSSARAFLTSQATGNPSAMASALRGNSPAPQPQGGPLDFLGSMFGGQGQPSQPSPAGGGNPLSGIPLIGGLFGGGSQNSAMPFGQPAGSAVNGGQGQGVPFSPGGQGSQTGAQPSVQSGVAGMSQNQLMSILSDPRTTPQEAQLLMSRLNPTPEKLSAGEGLVVRQPDGSYKTVATQAPKAEWSFNPDTGRITNSATGEQKQVADPLGHYTTNREGLTTNERTGTVTHAPGSSYRFMTEDEKRSAGIPLDQPMQIGPNGEMHGASGQTINVGGEQQTYGQAVAKTLAENHVGLMNGVDANRTKLRDLNLMSGALQRLQQNGGTTGMGAEEIAHLQSVINTGANTLGLGQQFDVSDKEAIGKVARQISGAAAKDIGGARTTNFDMQQMLEANPGLALSPTGNQRMLGIAQQVTQRNIDIGQQMQDATAAAVQQGRKPDPVAMEAIRANYDQQHHIVDPITGQDLSASPKLPEFNAGTPTGPAPAPSTPTGAAQGPNMATPSSQPVQVQTPQQAMALPPGTVFMTPDGRRKVR